MINCDKELQHEDHVFFPRTVGTVQIVINIKNNGISIGNVSRELESVELEWN